jgi:hypothetical protein
MKKNTIVRILLTALLLLGAATTPLLGDGGGPMPLCPHQNCPPLN